MKLNNHIIHILKSYRNEINQKKFKEIYDELNSIESIDYDIIGEFTQALIMSGVNPLKLDDSIKEVPKNYLANSKLIDSIYIPKDIIKINDFAFYNSSIQKIEFEPGIKLTHIGEGSFKECYNLKSIKLPSGLESLEYVCFSYIPSIDYLFLPKTLKYIGQDCFYGTYIEDLEYEGTMKEFKTSLLLQFFDDDTKGEIVKVKCNDGVLKL